MRPLAAGFGYRIEEELSSSRVTLTVRHPSTEPGRRGAVHAIVIAPGLSRALVDGRGLPLLDPPRYSDGILVVPPGLADLLRRLGAVPASAGRPYRHRREPGERPKQASRTGADGSRRIVFAPGLSRAPRILLGAGAKEPGKGGRGGEGGGKNDDAKDKDGKDEKPPPEGSAGFIVLDPGHGGIDNGASGAKGTREKNVVLDIARRMRPHLRRKGVRVAFTRTDDTYVALERRAEIANSFRPDALLSLHVNSFRNETVTGVETWVLDRELAPDDETAKKSRALARAVQRSLILTMRKRDRGVREGNYTVLRLSTPPTALVEMGFISNPATEKVLADARQRERIAAAVAKAVLDSGVLVPRKK
ncbi:MAG: N-acetylmuramoyl-L-alanine amidase family protein [Planctomycetota bacterium]